MMRQRAFAVAMRGACVPKLRLSRSAQTILAVIMTTDLCGALLKLLPLLHAPKAIFRTKLDNQNASGAQNKNAIVVNLRKAASRKALPKTQHALADVVLGTSV